MYQLIATVCNSISRLKRQTHADVTSSVVTSENVVQSLAGCEIILANMLQTVIKKDSMFLEESINTEVQLVRPPSYLNLNSKFLQRERKYEDDAEDDSTLPEEKTHAVSIANNKNK